MFTRAPRVRELGTFLGRRLIDRGAIGNSLRQKIGRGDDFPLRERRRVEPNCALRTVATLLPSVRRIALATLAVESIEDREDL